MCGLFKSAFGVIFGRRDFVGSTTKNAHLPKATNMKRQIND